MHISSALFKTQGLFHTGCSLSRPPWVSTYWLFPSTRFLLHALMQRNGSFTSLSTSLLRLLPAGPVRDTSTDSLVTLDDRFIKRSRKQSAVGGVYCFPNGEVFRPRNSPSKRNRPPKVDDDRRREDTRAEPRQLDLSLEFREEKDLLSSSRCGSLTLLPLAMPSGGAYLPKSPSFNSLKFRHKQDLANSIRKTKIDTPTNINISTFASTLATPLPHLRLLSLTNNKYNVNAANIVRLEHVAPSSSTDTIPHRTSGSDSNPSSLSNYNLNRSNSNTPQTSVNNSENDTSSPDHDPISPLVRCSSLNSIEESVRNEDEFMTPPSDRSSPSPETLGFAIESPVEETEIVLDGSPSDSSYKSAEDYSDHGDENGEFNSTGNANNGNDSHTSASDSGSLRSVGTERESDSNNENDEANEKTVIENEELEIDSTEDAPANGTIMNPTHLVSTKSVPTVSVTDEDPQQKSADPVRNTEVASNPVKQVTDLSPDNLETVERELTDSWKEALESSDITAELPSGLQDNSRGFSSSMSMVSVAVSELPEPTITLSEIPRVQSDTVIKTQVRSEFTGPFSSLNHSFKTGSPGTPIESVPPSPISKDTPPAHKSGPPTPIEKDSPLNTRFSKSPQKLKTITSMIPSEAPGETGLDTLVPALSEMPNDTTPSASETDTPATPKNGAKEDTAGPVTSLKQVPSVLQKKGSPPLAVPNSVRDKISLLELKSLNTPIPVQKPVKSMLMAPSATNLSPKKAALAKVGSSKATSKKASPTKASPSKTSASKASQTTPTKPAKVKQQTPKKISSNFLARKNIGFVLNIVPAKSKDNLPEVPTPVSKDTPPEKHHPPQRSTSKRVTSGAEKPVSAVRNILSSSDLSFQRPRTPVLENVYSPAISEFSFAEGEEKLRGKNDDDPSHFLPKSPSKVLIIDEVYPPDQIKRLLSDRQKEVPPRGDLELGSGSIKLQNQLSRANSVSSLVGRSYSPDLVPHKLQQTPDKILLKSSLPEKADNPDETIQVDETSNVTVEKTLETPDTPVTTSRFLLPGLQLANRLSMFNIVNVDFDKSLPPSPEHGKDSLVIDHLLATPPITPRMSPTIELPKKGKQEIHPMDSKRTTSMAGFKKMFRVFSDVNQSQPVDSARKLRSKTLKSSLFSEHSRSSLNSSKEKLPQTKTAPTVVTPAVPQPEPKAPKKNRRKNFLLNLKLASVSRVEELPSPIYTVRDKSTTPEVSEFPKQDVLYDLPQFEAEEDAFHDVLLRFDEVEKEAETAVEQSRLQKPMIKDFFLKDDELTKAQIADQQKNDNHFSDESLPRKFEEGEDLLPVGGEGYVDDNIRYLQNEMIWSQYGDGPSPKGTESFSALDEEQRLFLTGKELTDALGHNPTYIYPSYLTHVKQFKDFDQVEIRLKAFDPFIADEPPVSTSAVTPILKKESGSKTIPGRAVKFSNTISISETFPGYMYKRYNKSVTQYYLTESGEVNKIKNELNAYKCHEMLVHESSQNNTHFFY